MKTATLRYTLRMRSMPVLTLVNLWLGTHVGQTANPTVTPAPTVTSVSKPLYRMHVKQACKACEFMAKRVRTDEQ